MEVTHLQKYSLINHNRIKYFDCSGDAFCKCKDKINLRSCINYKKIIINFIGYHGINNDNQFVLSINNK